MIGSLSCLLFVARYLKAIIRLLPLQNRAIAIQGPTNTALPAGFRMTCGRYYFPCSCAVRDTASRATQRSACHFDCQYCEES
ncbi:hypothetical protein EDD16DRAFT_1539975 [Pisolithus croceorrhizus]|nr:hypothetical protein EDD16DRAFT_1539975 [Pisolithus croceorrhizus]KAI6161149.1 hypothetical protein EDD17DRAFT_1590247 [Pisolithus thermaeus]